MASWRVIKNTAEWCSSFVYGSFSLCLFRSYNISCVEGAVFIILLAVFFFYGYDTWSPTLSEKQRLMMFEKSMFRKKQGEYNRKSFKLCTSRQILCGWSIQERWDGRDMWQGWERRKRRTGFWWDSLENDDGRVKLKLIWTKEYRTLWGGWDVAADGDKRWPLVNVLTIVGCHKTGEISWLPEELLASQDRLQFHGVSQSASQPIS